MRTYGALFVIWSIYRHLIRSRSVTNQSFSQKRPFSFICAQHVLSYHLIQASMSFPFSIFQSMAIQQLNNTNWLLVPYGPKISDCNCNNLKYQTFFFVIGVNNIASVMNYRVRYNTKNYKKSPVPFPFLKSSNFSASETLRFCQKVHNLAIKKNRNWTLTCFYSFT